MSRQDGSIEKKGGLATRTCAVLAWLALWQAASMALAQPLLLPGPLEVAGSLAGLLSSTSFWQKVCFSAARVLGGMLGAYVFALAFAALSHRFATARAFLRVPLVVMKATPVVCAVVLLLLWLGSANVGVAAVFLMALPAVYFSALEGLDARDDGTEETLKLHGVCGVRLALASTWQRLLPFICASSESVVGMSWKAGIAAELIGVPAGSIGERIYQAKLLLETGDLIAWTLVVIAMAAVCERAFVWILRASGPGCLRLAVRMRPRSYPGTSDSPRGAWGLQDAKLAHGAAAGRPLTLERNPGSRTCVMAPSGCGKTTLLRTLAGLEETEGGCVSRPQRPSMVFQETRLVGGLTALENVGLCAAAWRSEEELRSLLGQALPEASPDTPVSELSGGQRRRVELVRAMAADGDAVLLDEPFTGLDDESRERVCKLVDGELHGRSLVIATHDEVDAARLGAEVFKLG